jgi:hypothetical protein
MELDLTKSSLWISVLIGAIIVAATSAGFQKYSENSEIKPKAVVRDAILGGIFVAMTWTLVPDSMTKITDSVTSSVINVANTASTATTSSLKTPEIDIQIGPAHF